MPRKNVTSVSIPHPKEGNIRPWVGAGDDCGLHFMAQSRLTHIPAPASPKPPGQALPGSASRLAPGEGRVHTETGQSGG
jgi:hypothetical protein